VRDQMWASFYPLDSLPANVRQLVDEARELAEKIVREHPEISLKHEHALQLLAQASLPVAAWNQLEGLIGLKILWHTAAGGPLRWLWTALAVMGLGALAGLWNLVPQGFFLMICGAVLIALVLAVRSWSGHRP